MGANCCTAAKSTSLSGTGIEISSYRNDAYSPSWSFRWDNRTHVEESVGNRSRFSRGNSGIISSEIKSSVGTEIEGISDGESPFTSFQTTGWQKSPSFEGHAEITVKGGERDLSIGSATYIEEQDALKLTTKPGRLTAKSFSFSPSSSVLKTDPSSSRSCSLLSDTPSSRKAHGSPSYQISRQISDSQISVLRSQNENSPADERHSLVLPNNVNEPSTRGSNGGSSDNWSVRMFSDLIAYSQRDRWSFDSDNNLYVGNGKISGSNHRSFSSPSAGLQKCGICSKLLKERSPWSGRKFVSNEVPVAAVLVCGHVYHADCLDNVTSEIERFDPSCPVCTGGGKHASKLSAKAELKSKSKISRIAVANIDIDNDSAQNYSKGALHEGKVRKLGASSSMKSPFNSPFLKRHFSLGLRTMRSSSENEGTKKKGFWFRHS